MGPAVDLDDVALGVEVVVDDVRVGDEIAAIALEDFVHGVTRVVPRELEEDVAFRRDEHPEVTCPASFLLLHEHAGGVGTEVGLLERVDPHRGDERFCELRERAVPSAHRGLRELETVAGVHVLKTIERHVILPALDDGLGQHSRAGESPWNGKIGRRRDEDIGLGIALAIFAHELRAHDARNDEGSGSTLDDLGDVLADPIERIETELLDLGRQHLDLDAWKMLGWRYPPRRLAPRVPLHILLCVGFGQSVGELRLLSFVEHQREDIERELRAIVGATLRLRR